MPAEISRRLTTAADRARGGASPRAPGVAVAGLVLLVVVAIVAADSAPSTSAGGGRSTHIPISVAANGSPRISPAPTASPSVTMTGSANDPAVTASPLPLPSDPSLPSPASSCPSDGSATCSAVASPSPFPSVDAAARTSFNLHVPILEYHRVRPPNGETGYAADLIVPPAVFERQMDAMSAGGWRTITMGQLGDNIRQGIKPPRNTFVITFDDGYEDGYLNALPILQSKGFVATFFVIASRTGSPGNLTAVELRDLVASGNEIGSHSWSHTNLLAKTPEQLTQETVGASARIARDSGAWPKSYSYPMGLRDAVVIEAVAATPGIEIAVVQEETRTESWATRFELPRIRVGPNTYPLELLYRASRYQS